MGVLAGLHLCRPKPADHNALDARGSGRAYGCAVSHSYPLTELGRRLSQQLMWSVIASGSLALEHALRARRESCGQERRVSVRAGDPTACWSAGARGSTLVLAPQSGVLAEGQPSGCRLCTPPGF